MVERLVGISKRMYLADYDHLEASFARRSSIQLDFDFDRFC